MANVDFSRNASVYDRRHGAILPDDAARQLVAGLRPGAAILDVGAGTGRVTLALTALGLRVIAIDPAQAMLDALRAKAAGVLVRLVRAEGGALPFRSASFDAVVLSRILYLISDWRRVAREAVRVLAPIETADCSYVWNVPEAIQRRCLPALAAWAAERFDLDRPEPFPREIRWTIYHRSEKLSAVSLQRSV